MPYVFKFKQKHSRSHIYFHAKINKVRCQLKGGGVMFGFQGEHGVKPRAKNNILKHPK